MSPHRSLVLAAAVVLAASCGSPDRAPSDADAGTGPATAPATSSPTTGPPAASGEPPPTAVGPGGGPAPTGPAAAAPPATRPTPPPAPGRPSRYVPAPGEYVYDVTGHVETTGIGGGREPVPPVSTDTVSVRGPADRQEMTVVTRDGDRGASQEIAVIVTADEAQLARLTYRPGGQGVAYDVHPEPPATIARFPYVAGSQWEIAWRDPATGIAGAGTGAISGPETVTTPVGTHETMVITVRQRIRGTVNGTLSVTSWLDPATGTVVKQHVITDFNDATGASRVDSTRTLRRLPA